MTLKTEKKMIIVTVSGGGFAGEAIGLLNALGARYEFTYVLGHLKEAGLEARLPFPGKVVRITAPTLIGTSTVSQIARLAKCLVQCLALVSRTRPAAVIGIGGSMCVPLLLAGRLWGARCVFIESLARTTNLSRTGRVIQKCRLSHRFYVQWPGLVKECSRAIYAGRVV